MQSGDTFRGRAVAQDGDGRIAWHNTDNEEDQRQDGEERRDRREQTADDVEDHGIAPRHLASPWPALCRPSTSCLADAKRDAGGRARPSHDEGAGPGVVTLT